MVIAPARAISFKGFASTENNVVTSRIPPIAAPAFPREVQLSLEKRNAEVARAVIPAAIRRSPMPTIGSLAIGAAQSA